MYNGIGLQTPRGSGTNGYIQTNKFFVRPRTGSAAASSGIPRPGKLGSDEASGGGVKKANRDIIDHDRKRRIELRLLVLEETLADQGYTDSEIAEKIAEARETFETEASAADAAGKDGSRNSDDGKRFSETQTHQVALRKEKQSELFRAALKLSRDQEPPSIGAPPSQSLERPEELVGEDNDIEEGEFGKIVKSDRKKDVDVCRGRVRKSKKAKSRNSEEENSSSSEDHVIARVSKKKSRNHDSSSSDSDDSSESDSHGKQRKSKKSQKKRRKRQRSGSDSDSDRGTKRREQSEKKQWKKHREDSESVPERDDRAEKLPSEHRKKKTGLDLDRNERRGVKESADVSRKRSRDDSDSRSRPRAVSHNIKRRKDDSDSGSEDERVKWQNQGKKRSGLRHDSEDSESDHEKQSRKLQDRRGRRHDSDSSGSDRVPSTAYNHRARGSRHDSEDTLSGSSEEKKKATARSVVRAAPATVRSHRSLSSEESSDSDVSAPASFSDSDSDTSEDVRSGARRGVEIRSVVERQPNQRPAPLEAKHSREEQRTEKTRSARRIADSDRYDPQRRDVEEGDHGGRAASGYSRYNGIRDEGSHRHLAQQDEEQRTERDSRVAEGLMEKDRRDEDRHPGRRDRGDDDWRSESVRRTETDRRGVERRSVRDSRGDEERRSGRDGRGDEERRSGRDVRGDEERRYGRDFRGDDERRTELDRRGDGSGERKRERRRDGP